MGFGLGLPRHSSNDRLLTETDGPFTKFGGRPACPADVADTLIELAKLRQIPLREMAATINKNLTAILSVAVTWLRLSGTASVIARFRLVISPRPIWLKRLVPDSMIRNAIQKGGTCVNEHYSWSVGNT